MVKCECHSFIPSSSLPSPFQFIHSCPHVIIIRRSFRVETTKVVQQKPNTQWTLDSKDEDKRGGREGDERSFSIKLNELATRPNCHQLSEWTTSNGYQERTGLRKTQEVNDFISPFEWHKNWGHLGAGYCVQSPRKGRKSNKVPYLDHSLSLLPWTWHNNRTFYWRRWWIKILI